MDSLVFMGAELKYWEIMEIYGKVDKIGQMAGGYFNKTVKITKKRNHLPVKRFTKF